MLLAAIMSSTPGSIVTSVEPETESVHPEQGSAKGGIQAEPKVEPHPEWSTAVEKWGAVWELHQFGLGSLFGIIGLFAFLAFFKLLKNNRACRQKKVSLIVLSQIVLFGLSRWLFLCVDAYHSKGHVPSTVVNVIWGIGQPCLITAFMLIFLVLRNALVMKSRFQNWYTTRNIALVTVPYYNFVFVSKMTVSFLPSNKSVIFACQITDTVLYVILASFYSYISSLMWKKIRVKPKGTSAMHDRGKQTLSVFKLFIAAAVGGFSIGAMQIYALISLHSVSYDAKNISPWPWFAFTTSLRCLELGMSVLLYMTGTINTAGQRVRGRINVAALSTMQSKAKTGVTENSEKSDTFQILQLKLQSTYAESNILPSTGTVSFVKCSQDDAKRSQGQLLRSGRRQAAGAWCGMMPSKTSAQPFVRRVGIKLI